MLWLVSLLALASDRPDFESIVRQAIAECAPDIPLVAVRCDAEPCVATFADEKVDWGRISQCPNWKNAYGSTVSTLGGHAVCADGTRRPYFLLAPDNGDGHASARIRQVRKAFPCGS